MAQDITLLGATYSDVPAVTLPKASGGSATFVDAEDVSKGLIYFGTCSTGASTAAKTVSIDGIDEYYAGLNLRILFTTNQTYNGVPTLNVNSLGAKNIRRLSGTNAARYEWLAGEVLDLVYNGTYFVIIDGGIATTTYYGVTKLSTSAISTATNVALTPSALNDISEYTISGLEPYSSSSTYAIGDRIRTSTYIYRCSTAITKPEAWNVAHWTAEPSLLERIEELPKGFDIETPSFSSLPQTFYSSGLTANCKVVGNAIELSNPDAASDDWTVTFAAGSLTISGTFTGSTATTAKMSIWIPSKTITLSSTA